MATVHSGKTSARMQKHGITNRRVIYFSGKMLGSVDLRREQEYLRTKSTVKDRPLYIIEMSGISSKYIGETEKNLRAIFKKIKDMDGILLFDEADALFGKRGKVKDAHDRYANIETNYLLERIQKYDGIMFMTPNHKKPITMQGISKLDYIVCLHLRSKQHDKKTESKS